MTKKYKLKVDRKTNSKYIINSHQIINKERVRVGCNEKKTDVWGIREIKRGTREQWIFNIYFNLYLN